MVKLKIFEILNKESLLAFLNSNEKTFKLIVIMPGEKYLNYPKMTKHEKVHLQAVITDYNLPYKITEHKNYYFLLERI
jgi:hypothetical protein